MSLCEKRGRCAREVIKDYRGSLLSSEAGEGRQPSSRHVPGHHIDACPLPSSTTRSRQLPAQATAQSLELKN